MSSYIETLDWCHTFTLDRFDWSAWIEEFAWLVSWPVYDMTQVVDSSAAFDIALHAKHFPASRAKELTGCWIGESVRSILCGAGLQMHHEQCYAFTALYKLCSTYTVGMNGCSIKRTPVDFMDNVPMLPPHIKSFIDQAWLSEDNQKQITCWLENVIKYGMRRSTTVYVRLKTCRKSFSQAEVDSNDLIEHISATFGTILSSVRLCSTLHIPRMSHTVMPLPPSRISIVLYVTQRTPSDV